MAILLRPDGSALVVTPKNGTDFCLEELQFLVDGYIQLINLDDDKCLVVDDDGKVKNKPVNDRACTVLRNVHVVVGDALLCDRKEVQ